MASILTLFSYSIIFCLLPTFSCINYSSDEHFQTTSYQLSEQNQTSQQINISVVQPSFTIKQAWVSIGWVEFNLKTVNFYVYIIDVQQHFVTIAYGKNQLQIIVHQVSMLFIDQYAFSNMLYSRLQFQFDPYWGSSNTIYQNISLNFTSNSLYPPKAISFLRGFQKNIQMGHEFQLFIENTTVAAQNVKTTFTRSPGADTQYIRYSVIMFNYQYIYKNTNSYFQFGVINDPKNFSLTASNKFCKPNQRFFGLTNFKSLNGLTQLFNYFCIIVIQCTKTWQFYDQKIKKCVDCQTVFPNCSKCMRAECKQCVSQYIINETKCIKCQILYENCIECNDQTCILCPISYYLNEKNCTQCSDTYNHCTRCNDKTCIQCQMQFSLQHTMNSYSDECIPIDCGDGNKTSNEECDDGNNIQYDGCFNCKEEKGFSCNSTFTQKWLCQYQQDIKIGNTLGIYKQRYENSIDILVQIQTKYQAVLPFAAASGIIQFHLDSDNQKERLLQEDETSMAIISVDGVSVAKISYYYKDLISQRITVALNPMGNYEEIPQNQKTFNINEASNNLKIANYPSAIYILQFALQIFNSIISCAVLALFIAGFITAKTFILELAEIFQVTYLMQSFFTDQNPLLSSLSGLCYSIGYNLINYSDTAQYMHWKSSYKYANGMKLGSTMLSNVNIMLASIGLPLLVAVVAFAISKINNLSKVRKIWLKLIRNSALFQCGLYSILFLYYIVVFTLINQIILGLDIATTLIGAALIVFLIIYLILFICYPIHFGEFRQLMRRDGIQKQYYVVLMVKKVIITTAFLSIHFTRQVLYGLIPFALIILAYSVDIIFLKVSGSYLCLSNQDNNKRPIINNSIGVSITFVLVAVKILNQINDTITSEIALYLPLAIPLLLFSLVLITIAYFYGRIKQYRDEFLRKQIEENMLMDNRIINVQKNNEEWLKQLSLALKQALNVDHPVSIYQQTNQINSPNFVRKKENEATQNAALIQNEDNDSLETREKHIKLNQEVILQDQNSGVVKTLNWKDYPHIEGVQIGRTVRQLKIKFSKQVQNENQKLQRLRRVGQEKQKKKKKTQQLQYKMLKQYTYAAFDREMREFDEKKRNQGKNAEPQQQIDD